MVLDPGEDVWGVGGCFGCGCKGWGLAGQEGSAQTDVGLMVHLARLALGKWKASQKPHEQMKKKKKSPGCSLEPGRFQLDIIRFQQGLVTFKMIAFSTSCIT